jgi:hypothetical protein
MGIMRADTNDPYAANCVLHGDVGVVQHVRLRLDAEARSLRRLAALLLATSLLLLAIHVIVGAAAMAGVSDAVALWEGGWWRVDAEPSVSEIYEYVLLVLAAGALLTVWCRTELPVFAVLAGIGVVLALDNHFRVHETVGAALVADNATLGEILYFAAIGTPLAAVLAATTLRTPSSHRGVALVFIGLLALLVGFGVGVDALHAVVVRAMSEEGLLRTVLDQGFVVLEDGGELLTMTLFAIAAFALVHPRNAER